MRWLGSPFYTIRIVSFSMDANALGLICDETERKWR
jgi:hypothetical protein